MINASLGAGDYEADGAGRLSGRPVTPKATPHFGSAASIGPEAPLVLQGTAPEGHLPLMYNHHQNRTPSPSLNAPQIPPFLCPKSPMFQQLDVLNVWCCHNLFS